MSTDHDTPSTPAERDLVVLAAQLRAARLLEYAQRLDYLRNAFSDYDRILYNDIAAELRQLASVVTE